MTIAISEDSDRTPAERGLALLEQHGPDGWRDRIDLEQLNMGSTRNCVLGQVYGGYMTGRNLLLSKAGLACTARAAWDHGFDCANVRNYPALTRQWRDLLTRDAAPLH